MSLDKRPHWQSQVYSNKGGAQDFLLWSAATCRSASVWYKPGLALLLTSCHSTELWLLTTWEQEIIPAHECSQIVHTVPQYWVLCKFNEIIIFPPCCWCPPSLGLFSPGECLWLWFLSRLHLYSCSRPHNPQTPKTQEHDSSRSEAISTILSRHECFGVFIVV